MILVDRRVGSAELVPVLEFQGLKTEITDLAFGDIAFEGHGPRGLCMIGIERKVLRDMIQSMRSGRFSAHQLPGMVQTYDFGYLIVEGGFRGNPQTGIIEEYTRLGQTRELLLGSTRYMFRELDNYLNSLELRTPIHIKRTLDPNDTAVAVANLYHHWNDKTWDRHRAHTGFYSDSSYVLLSKENDIPLVRRWAKELYLIGWEKSVEVLQRFRTGIEMANAPKSEWLKIPGIGTALADAAYREIRGENVRRKK